MKNRTKYAVVFLVLIMCSCRPYSQIPISNTLEIALDKHYTNYVMLLNKAVKNDTTSLRELLEIDNIGDGAGYDHGWILIELMKKIGDKNFSDALKRMNSVQVNNVKDYFRVGLDAKSQKDNYFLLQKYPESFKDLKFNRGELKLFFE